MRTRRLCRFLSSFGKLNPSALAISGLTSWRLTFDTCGVVQRMRTVSATQAASVALTTEESRGAVHPVHPVHKKTRSQARRLRYT